MIVEPVPTNPRSPVRRGLRVAAMTIPLVLLVGVVAAGVLGPKPAPPATQPADPASAPPAVALAGPEESAAESPLVPAGVAFPQDVAGLDVEGVGRVVEARARGQARGLIAVAGYLGIEAVPTACDDPRLGMFGAFCPRVAVLTEKPWFGGTLGRPDAAGSHLHPQLPVGVRMPSQATLTASSASTQTPPVVLLGRFGDPRAVPCVPGGRHCGQEFVVERVAWVDGREYPNTLTVDPLAGASARSNAELRAEARLAAATLGPRAVPLLTALVAPGTLARIDPALTGAGRGLEDGVPVWLVRALAERGDPGRITWAVMDPSTGRRLAAGELDTGASR